MAPQVLAIFGDKNIDINNKKAKRKATTWGFPIFLTDKPSFFRGFDEPMESRYNSKPILLLVNNYFFYLKGIQNVRKDVWCCLINEKEMQKFNCLLSSSAVVKHSSPYLPYLPLFLTLPSVPCGRMRNTFLSLSRRISTCLIQTFGSHTQERTDQVQDPGKIVFIAHLIRFSLFPAKLIRIYFW